MIMNQQLQAFDFSSVINTASAALKANLPNLIETGIQKRVAQIQAARAEKIAAAAARNAAAQAPMASPAPGTLPATTSSTRGLLQNLPSWVIPALIALIVAFIKLRGSRRK